MKTQISRDSFQSDKRYTGIHQQQGRILTDADWNELVAICREQLKRTLSDVVGNGSPRTGALSITSNRRIQPGDLYVEGLRAELPGSVPFAANVQPDLPGYPELSATGSYVVYADIWERAVTSLEDATLRDPGLHGADTCTRTQTMLQVKTCPETVNPETAIPRRGNATLSLSLHTSLEAGDPCDPCAGLISADQGRVGSYLFRLEAHAVEGAAGNPTRLILKWSSENGAEQHEALPVEQMPPGFVAGNYVYEFHNLITEKHLGVFLGTGFTPTRGALRTSYEIPDTAPRELVRRWDGYCELRRSGAVWSLVSGVDRGVVLTTGGAATAPGHVALGASLQVNLEALQLVLDLSGKTFIAGDFWLAPVREAVDGPGSTVLGGAEPKGIEHHYLRLARVQADGTVVPYENDADQRRHRFPPLTDLRAHDVGYETTCGSGLFDASHDNVEKALNRLCQLAAEHIAYTATCTAGLYAGFSGTVKQALDLICTIQAAHVGFAKPCDTSLYQGQTIATVADALRLLCDIRAGHIAYAPGGDCTFLNQPGINTVQAALDALCSRPVGSGGGCRITVGEGGRYASLEEALKDLLERRERNICLCLLPGEHVYPGQSLVPSIQGVNLCLSGCGPATLLTLEREPVRFRDFASVCLKDLTMVTHEAPSGALLFDNCPEVSLNDVSIHGFVPERSLVEVRRARSVELTGLELEASGPESLSRPASLFEFNNMLFDLYQMADWAFFSQKVAGIAQILADMARPQRTLLANTLRDRLRDVSISVRERQSYVELIAVLREPQAAHADLVSALNRIRVEAIRERPVVALAIADASCDLNLAECDILGILSLYGAQPAGPLPPDVVKNLDALVAQGGVTFGALGTTFRAEGCRITRIDVSTVIAQRIQDIVASGGGTLPALFSSAFLSDLTLLQQDNQLAFQNISLSTSVFEVESARAAVVMGNSSIYVGNRGDGEAVIMDITPAGRSERAANLGLVISS